MGSRWAAVLLLAGGAWVLQSAGLGLSPEAGLYAMLVFGAGLLAVL
jgi:hypothetical protein